MIIRYAPLRMRIVTVLAVCLLSIPAYGAPALANDEPPPTRSFTVTRGGQTFQRTAFETELAPDGRLMRAGSFLVTFRARAGRLDQDAAHRLAGALGIERLFSADTVRVQVGRARTSAALLAYLGNPAVERVEPDYVARVVDTPNDPRFAEQWGMTKIRAGFPAVSPGPSAWDVSKSSAETRIAVLDCGVYNESSSTFASPDGLVGHPDLRGKVTDNKNFTTAPDSDDFCNHGTHVAGIAAANTNNGIGVAGVGYAASIVNVKVLGDNGSGSFSWIINGILYAAGCDGGSCTSRRADIINMSLGATGPCSTSVQAAIDKAWGQGLVIVAAAGNAGASGAITPANCDHVIGVAASDQNDAKATFSNFGAGVDVAAPGVGILSSDFVGGYSSFSGTSMASPHVAGLAALVWTIAAHNNLAVVDRITCTANENALAGSTHGRIDAYAAVVPDACAPPPPTPSLSINDVSATEGDTGTTSVTFTVTRSGGTTQTTVNFATSNGTASSPSDYTAVTGALTFANAETTKEITVLVTGDTTLEANETFNVILSGATNATIADAQGVGTILNDDLPAITITDVSATERRSGTRNFNFTVRLSSSSSQTVTVEYETANVTASGGAACGSGVDYLVRNGTLTFTPGTTSRTISVPVCGDRTLEANETFNVNLPGATNATIADAQGVGTIVNDD